MSGIIRRHFTFSEEEIYGLLMVAVFLGFMFSFRKWGAVTPDISAGLWAMFIAALLAIIAMLVHIGTQKAIGLSMGYAVNWAVEMKGLLVSLLLTFLSTGYLVLPFCGSVTVDPISELRFGHKPGFKFRHLGWIAASGPIANLFLALLLRIIWNFVQIDIISGFAMMNIMLAVAMALPVPSADGLHLFFASRLDYVAYLATIILFAVLLATPLPIKILLLLAPLIALVSWIGYWLIEKNFK